MSAVDIEFMERARLRDANPVEDLSDDRMLDAIRRMMVINPHYGKAMNELIDELLIRKGEGIAIDMGLEIRDALEDA